MEIEFRNRQEGSHNGLSEAVMVRPGLTPQPVLMIEAEWDASLFSPCISCGEREGSSGLYWLQQDKPWGQVYRSEPPLGEGGRQWICTGCFDQPVQELARWVAVEAFLANAHAAAATRTSAARGRLTV